MKAARLVFALVLLVASIGIASAGGLKGGSGKAHASSTTPPVGGVATDSITCTVDCGNGNGGTFQTPTRGSCLDACEAICQTTCTLVN